MTMINLCDMINEGLDYESKDYDKFMRDYKKFRDFIKDEKFNDKIQTLTDDFVKKIDVMVLEKEKEIMKI